MTRTKIVCTLGPSTSDKTKIESLVMAGMNVARINFSHGSHEELHKMIGYVRTVSAATDNPIAILGDLCGPKIRIGELESKTIRINPGDKLTITTRDIVGNAAIVSTTYHNLVSDVNKGDAILIDDGSIEL